MTSRRRRQTRALTAPFTGWDPVQHNAALQRQKRALAIERALLKAQHQRQLRVRRAFSKLSDAFLSAGGAFAAFQGSVGRSYAQQVEARSDHERRLAIADESPGVRDEIMLALKARYSAGLTVVHPTRPMTTLHNA
jgi:hypothetical protein